ncbi:MAG: transglutaminase domain-containing protein [Niabella sp.]
MKKIFITAVFCLVLFHLGSSQKANPVIKALYEYISENENAFGGVLWASANVPPLYNEVVPLPQQPLYPEMDSITKSTGTDIKGEQVTDTWLKKINHNVPRLPYMDMLKQTGRYNFSEVEALPVFTYQSMNNEALVRVRRELKLDSVAGNGSEISKILNLMHWVHDMVRHDGDSENPRSRNAIDLLAVAKQEDRALNCRMMAIILNECYLAMGFKSRYVVCMPREKNFEDCHVINTVYSDDLQKWIWIDPTFNAYLTDNEGTMLGIAEVRERLLKGLPLVLNPDANWNKTWQLTGEQYLEYYMARYLYRFESPLASGYDLESRKNGKELTYVELLPVASGRKVLHATRKSDVNHGMTFTYYKTSNPRTFWAKP